MQSGRLQDAISILENLLRANPREHLEPSVLFSLCTMYDLENEKAAAAKKKVLVELVERYADDDFDLSQLPIKS